MSTYYDLGKGVGAEESSSMLTLLRSSGLPDGSPVVVSERLSAEEWIGVIVKLTTAASYCTESPEDYFDQVIRELEHARDLL